MRQGRASPAPHRPASPAHVPQPSQELVLPLSSRQGWSPLRFGGRTWHQVPPVPVARRCRGAQESHQSVPSRPGSRLRRLGKAHSDNAGSDIFIQKCRERSAPAGAGGAGRRREQLLPAAPQTSRSEPCARRSGCAGPGRAQRVGPTARARGATLAGVRDGAEAQRADWHLQDSLAQKEMHPWAASHQATTRLRGEAGSCKLEFISPVPIKIAGDISICQ